MNCDQFRSWLENRDISDQSESDRALRHRQECLSCKELFAKDVLLEKVIEHSMQKQPLPDNLEKIISINLGSTHNSYRKIPTVVIRITSMVAGIAALVLIFLFVPTDFSKRNEFGKSLVQDHLHHNYSQDMESINDIQQWLLNHASFTATIPAEFDGGGKYKIVGGRICIINGCMTVHLVYQEGNRLLSLYISDEKEVEAKLKHKKIYSVSNNGYEIRMWRELGQVYALVI